ncbi:MAG: FAD-binding protein, partial [Magnetococcales bacterium]|nr:FAD-binding protein [Magnetococcales bacterium]
AWDNTGLRYPPKVVVLAETTHQVAAALKCCHKHTVTVTPRGAGSGNVGGALAVQGGVVLSTQRMNRIREINPEDRLAVVEPGVVNDDLQTAVQQEGLFWPPDPSSSRVCTVGGNIAMCSAGPGAVRFGVTRDWVLGLTAVRMDGTILRTGGRTTKGVTGYDLTRLLIGSEGTLAVVTEATLKLAPRPEARRLLRALFPSVASAALAVSALMRRGTPPCAVEFLDGAALGLVRESGIDIPPEGEAMLLLEACGSQDQADRLAEELEERLQRLDVVEVMRARNEEEASQVWEARLALSPVLKKLAPKRINEDVVVPVSRLAELIQGLEEISREVNFPIVNFGHAGNGNIHVNLLADPDDPEHAPRIPDALNRVFGLVMDLDGTLSGEHGIGIRKRPYLGWEQDEEVIALQRAIKGVFDPKGLLNPDKVLPLPDETPLR